MGRIAKINGNILQRKIREALESGPLTFDDLKDIAHMPKSTLSNVLKEMENQRKIKRLVALHEEKKKKQRRYKILIQLMPALTSPTSRTIEHLSKISDLISLDAKRGKELLTSNAADALLVISTLDQNIKTFFPRCLVALTPLR